MMYHIYVLRSKKDQSIYLDHTSENIENRLEAHNNGLIKYTQDHRPWSLVYCKSSTLLDDSRKSTNRLRYITKPLKNIRNRIKERLSRPLASGMPLSRLSFVERYLITKGR